MKLNMRRYKQLFQYKAVLIMQQVTEKGLNSHMIFYLSKMCFGECIHADNLTLLASSCLADVIHSIF